jgi:hypothetical protein
MFSVVHNFRFALVAGTVAMLLMASTQSHAQEVGEVRINILKAAFIVGIGGGTGTLTYRGQTYPLTVGGINVGSLGIADVELTGTASNLRTASDIAGTYGGSTAGAAIIGGGQVATVQNEKGVVLRLQGGQIGLQVTFAVSGMTIGLQ